MRFATVSAVLVATLATSVVAPLAGQEAPTTTAPASKVPVRELTPPNATSSDHFGLILSVRGLPDGKLLVNDPGRHQLVLLDAGLRRAAIVFDSVAGGSQSYPPGYAPIIPFPGDSTLFVDRAAVSLVVISPSGTVGRTMAPPIAADMLFLAGRGAAKAQEQRDMEAIKAMVANRTPAAGAGAEASVKASGLGSNLPGSAAETAPARTEVVREYGWLTIGDIADYYPPIRSGALKADMDANLWILPTTSAQSKSGELVYDVVNNRGELTERVRVPAGRSIAGFGKGGEVYLMVREANGWVLERVYLRR